MQMAGAGARVKVGEGRGKDRAIQNRTEQDHAYTGQDHTYTGQNRTGSDSISSTKLWAPGWFAAEARGGFWL